MFYRPPRRPASMEVWLRVGSKKLTVSVLDVSESGAKITAPDGLALDMRVVLATPRFEREAMVRWVQGKHAGLTLEAPLSQSEQMEISGMSAGF
ncbi:PilZ domain protein [Jannaschia seosinensis]|uniref:PilZ domain protein n=1 Tax=Jannaschia seosinensis TaxID=313367 RepID=A0A0M7BDN0_9RHOB|nr:PilZ domain-containing protein [Jannaschia seosinensis]CUH40907.1 PilZ domain protein [Jannaschia seosinensis]